MEKEIGAGDRGLGGGGEVVGEVVEPTVDLVGGIAVGVADGGAGTGDGGDVAGQEVVVEIGLGVVVEEFLRVAVAVVDG
ncbi:hypothetical protein [Streptomyces sp. NBC_01438]|uniref:hypothetical protein n=1 Tax=Streptomyces sp. NBC_01438 TaxID=2903866 RepID=UPI00325410A3